MGAFNGRGWVPGESRESEAVEVLEMLSPGSRHGAGTQFSGHRERHISDKIH